MASILEETTEFVEGITQFDTTDPIEGGPAGIDNEPHKQLAARTNWLRRKLESETRQIIVNDAEGVPHYMVWIPRIILPAGALGTGIPSQDLYLGGFAVDQFLCAVETGKAISHPLKLPTNSITLADAQTAAAARVIEGAACEMLSAKDWGHLAWLVDLIGHPIEGSLVDGAFPGSEDWDGRGEPGTGRNIGVSGPAAWYHNGLPSGIKDLVGNLYHMCPINMSLAQIYLTFTVELANGISDSDPTINLLDLNDTPQGAFYGWPLDGAVLVTISDGVNTEYIDYATLTIDGVDPTQGLLSGCVRGRFGGAHSFVAGSTVTITRPFWAVEDAWAARLDGALGDQITDTELTLKAFDLGLSPLPVPMAGDVLSIGDEDVLVTDVDGLTCTIERAQNGTAIAAHNDSAYVYRYSPLMARTMVHAQVGHATGAIRGGLLEEYYLRNPGVAVGMAKVRYFMGGSGDVLCRGGASAPGAWEPEGGLAEVFLPGSSTPSSGLAYTGFRCVWRPNFD